MTTTLRVVLDQLVAPTDPDLAMASRELARALLAASPRGCEVAGVVPAASADALEALGVKGLAGVTASAIPRRELSTALTLGLPSGLGGGMLHSPTLFAPLVRHDRAHKSEQTVVTIWDLSPWTDPGSVSKASVAWHRAMLKRAERYADAVIVPLHSMAEELAERSKLGGRIRVIAGAAPEGFAVPRDEVGRRRELGVPEGAVVVDASGADSEGVTQLVARLGEGSGPVLVLGGDDETAAALGDSAVVLGQLDDAGRAAVVGAASVVVHPGVRPLYPWRVVEALVLGVPVVASESAVMREVLADGGIVVDADPSALATAVQTVLSSGDARTRAATLAADRGRGFSWREAGERVWQLHADL
ncbi:hypothetical protein GCM10009808_02520 [Microbacterium sediminicola]|uniref:D-inositol 3-phosphate glycosyltransferase n=1 Tax=Microbacterium sediminicola TaxID=415210 RepID=A0ABN2HJN8_9MICO